MMSLEDSPILFKSLNEVPEDEEEDDDDDDDGDDDDTDDLVVDGPPIMRTFQSAGTNGVFGANLKTFRTDPKERSKGKRFCHKLHKIDYSKEHGLLNDLKEGDELLYVNKSDVSSWSHDTLLRTIQDLDEEITFVFYREEVTFDGPVERTDKLYISITFVISDLGADHKGAIEDIKSRIKKVLINITRNVSFSQRLRDPIFEGKQEVKIRHGAMIHDYLMVEKQKPVMKQIGDSSDAYTFTVYSYVVTDEKLKKERYLVAFQCDKNKKFLMCSVGSKKLCLVKDNDIDEDLANIDSNSPVLFFMIQSGEDKTFFFESVACEDHFLAYDKVDLLHLAELDVPPDSPDFVPDECIRRNLTFTLE